MAATLTRVRGAGGYTLAELLISMGILGLVMGATVAGLKDAYTVNDAIVQMTGMNKHLRAAMDLMVRDLMQVGSDLPPGHVIPVPWGGSAAAVRIPGPPGTAFTNPANNPDDSADVDAVIPGPGRGPSVNGVASDTITVLTADNDFRDREIAAMTSTTVTMPVGVDLTTGDTRVTPGQLLMVKKSSGSTLVQVTAVNAGARMLTFGDGDSLRLNQRGTGMTGNLETLIAAAPTGAAGIAATRLTRIRMISYYLDTTVANRPRLVRRINNGHETDFDNTLGTAVALDVESLQFTYDIADGQNNPSGVKFVAADFTTGGACAPNACNLNMIRKINVLITGRSRGKGSSTKTYRNTLTSQVSLRGMAFVNEYKQ